MLVAVVDREGRGGTRTVKSTFEEVEARLGAHGLRLRRPVSVEIASMAIMGATKSKDDGHSLFVSSRAVQSGMLDGLLAHEMGHMLLTESGHPSHDPGVLVRLMREIDLPKAARGAFDQGYNHVQDVYADDLAFLVGLEDRAHAFFASWILGNTGQRGRHRWTNVGLCVTNGFALGNLARHGLLPPDDELWEIARSFDREAGFRAVESFARFYENLPPNPTSDSFVVRVRVLANLMQRTADGG